MQSLGPALAIGAIAVLVPVLMARFPPAPRGSSPYDDRDLERRNRLLKLLVYAVFAAPWVTLAWMLMTDRVENSDIHAGAFFISLAFVLPPIAVFLIAVSRGWDRVREFARYLELSDRLSTAGLIFLMIPIWIASAALGTWGALHYFSR